MAITEPVLSVRKLLPITASCFIVGWLAIAGVPPFSGFWSKDDILLYAFDFSKVLWFFGFIMAAVGSSVGLGNIWRFTYTTGENGGGAFVLAYLVTHKPRASGGVMDTVKEQPKLPDAPVSAPAPEAGKGPEAEKSKANEVPK